MVPSRGSWVAAGREVSVPFCRSVAESWVLGCFLGLLFWLASVAGRWRRWWSTGGSGWGRWRSRRSRSEGSGWWDGIDLGMVGSSVGRFLLLILGVGLARPWSDRWRSWRSRRDGPGRWAVTVRRRDEVDLGMVDVRGGSLRLLVLGVGLVLPSSGWGVARAVRCRIWLWDEVAVGGAGWMLLQAVAVNGGSQRLWAFSFWAWIGSRCWAWASALVPITCVVVCFLFSVCLLSSVVVLVSRSACRIFTWSLFSSVKVVVGASNRWSDLVGWVVAIGTQHSAGLLPCVLSVASAEVAGKSWDGPPNSLLLWLDPVPVAATYFGPISSTVHLIWSPLLDPSTSQSSPIE